MSGRRSVGEPLYFVKDSLFFDLPMYFDMLNDDDKNRYVDLKQLLSNHKSGKGVDRKKSFVDQLLLIQNYVERDDADDWKRGLVCGIIFLENSIAVNIQQFLKVINKCKSSVNGLFQKIGFSAHPQGSRFDDELINKVPIFQQEKNSVKRWTVRDCIANENPFRCAVSSDISRGIRGVDSVNVGTVAVEPKRVDNMYVPIKFRYKSLITNRNIAIQT